MTIDRPTLVKLYKIALEEARHRDRLYTQTWVAVAITASVFFAVFGFFFKQLSVISGCWITGTLILLGLVFGGFFTYSVFRLAREREICCDIAKKLSVNSCMVRSKMRDQNLKKTCLLGIDLARLSRKAGVTVLSGHLVGKGGVGSILVRF